MEKERVIENLFQTFNMMMCEHKVSRTYGTKAKLSFSEMGLLQVVRTNEHAKASELSVLLGMTNGAVTQLAKKCMDKGMIVSYQVHENRKEVFYKLTEEGTKACNGYDKHYLKLKNALLHHLDLKNENEVNAMNELLEVAKKELGANKNCALITHDECDERRCAKCKKIY